MLSPEDFRPVATSMAPSQPFEVLLDRQAVLGPYRTACTGALRKLDPEVVQGLLAEYQPIEPDLSKSLYDAIARREDGVDNQIGQSPNMEWLRGAGNANDTGFLAEDDWNPSPGT
jgi:hypothetical protein